MTTTNAEHLEARIEIARDMRDAAQWEIGQTRTGQSALLTSISILGTGLGLVGTWGTRHQGGPWGAALIEVSAYIFCGALLSIFASMHPRGLPPTRIRSGAGVTGWPLLLAFVGGTPDDDTAMDKMLDEAAADRDCYYARDARTKARIAYAKHGWQRASIRLISFGFALGVVGVRLWIGGI